MQAYLGGQDVTLTIPLVDSTGVDIDATSVSYRVIGQAENVLVAKDVVSTFAAGDTTVSVSVSGDINTLPSGESLGLRVVELYVKTDIGTIKLEYGYFIEAEEVLAETVNSFQSYNAAMFLAYEMPNIPGWNEATKSDRIAAMIAARRNIGRLRFRYVFDAYQNIVDNTMGIADLTLATAQQWNAMPKQFRDAVCRAQIAEADFLLGGQEYGDLRRAGLVSMTVGEAKQFFRPSKPFQGVVCERAMRELGKFVLFHTRITRT